MAATESMPPGFPGRIFDSLGAELLQDSLWNDELRSNGYPGGAGAEAQSVAAVEVPPINDRSLDLISVPQ